MIRSSSSALLLWASAACASLAPDDAALPSLRSFEDSRRAATDFRVLPSADQRMGPDPYAIVVLPGASGYAGILRGQHALVQLDRTLVEVERLAAPDSPTGLAIAANGDLFVSGEASPLIARYRLRDGRLAPAGVLRVPEVFGVRAIATGPGEVVYAVAESRDRLLTLHLGRENAKGTIAFTSSVQPVPAGPFQVRRAGDRVIVNCLIAHTLLARRVDKKGDPLLEGEVKVVHDGPIWGFDVYEDSGNLWVAFGGIEDHPLDRRGGSFGFIDSFFYLARIENTAWVSLGALNLSELGVVTPKAVHFESPNRVFVAGYGTDRAATIAFDAATQTLKSEGTTALPPGTNLLIAGAVPGAPEEFIAANPLLDSWVALTKTGTSAVLPVAGEDGRDARSKLGEVLFFTTEMAPWNKSEGPLSRFTCEACHYEGYVDGRTHHTGRGEVHATTRPLAGLFNGRPYFSRALDPDLATMVSNEFRVAGAKSGHDFWFGLAAKDVPWLELQPDDLEPAGLRRALMSFFMDFSHRPNPAVLERASFSPLEREGAAVFLRDCERCHNARLISDDPASRVRSEDWEPLVLSREGALLFGRSGYEKTGVVPYVHPQGARVPSLRRLHKKRPYFTNGSAPDLDRVLESARFDGARFFHAGAPDEASLRALREDERRALRAFLDLL